MHHTLVYKYTEDVNSLGDNITTAMNNTEVLLLASIEVALEVNAEKLSPERRKKHYTMKTASTSFQNMEKPKKGQNFSEQD